MSGITDISSSLEVLLTNISKQCSYNDVLVFLIWTIHLFEFDTRKEKPWKDTQHDDIAVLKMAGFVLVRLNLKNVKYSKD